MLQRNRLFNNTSSGVRTGGQNYPIDDLKKLFLKRSAFFHTEFAEIAVMFFYAIQLAY